MVPVYGSVFEFDVLKCPECNGRLNFLLRFIHPSIYGKYAYAWAFPAASSIARAVFERPFEEF